MKQLLLAFLVICLETCLFAQSQTHYCKLDTPKDFNGKAGLIDALQILHITVDSQASRAVVQYREGWIVTDANGIGDVQGPPDHVFQWTWGPEVKDDKGNVILPAFKAHISLTGAPGVSRETDLLRLVYKYLAVSRPNKEYSCALVENK